MGVIGNQPPRRDHSVDDNYLENTIKLHIKLANKHRISVENVIKIRDVLEKERLNDMLVEFGDFHDEHMGGLADLIQELIGTLREISDTLTTKTKTTPKKTK